MLTRPTAFGIRNFSTARAVRTQASANCGPFFYGIQEQAMSIVRVGSTQKFSDNWDKVFSGKSGSKTPKQTAKKAGKKAAKKSAAKRPTVKPTSGKAVKSAKKKAVAVKASAAKKPAKRKPPAAKRRRKSSLTQQELF
jgi:hypothetical protein